MSDNNLIDNLIKLSDIFKDGFTIELIEGKIINQYCNIKKPYIVSYLTVIEIKDNKPLFKNIQCITNNCIIGGWYNIKTKTYYIELNKAFDNIEEALIFAYKFNQEAIYSLKAHKCLYLKNFIGKRYLTKDVIKDLRRLE